ncbi:ribokinase [Halogranum amylolyticum]|uniref:Ribokinase n=1 Tax=Halogranum amylolyticum TaxID=660520 RepID=A0A1H8N9J3_9EURY|nr:PfkB family carbohydrate kinase [Halogranum amylolyticum]SEO26280.1 ribokinase [Halogranum amylolyticum]
MPRVICAGHVNWDITLRVDRLPEVDGEAAIQHQTGAGGGSAANVAVALAGLRVPVSLLGSVGDDEHGRAARRELTGTGVDCDPLQTVSDGKTAVKYLVVDGAGEVMVLGQTGVNEAFQSGHLPGATLSEADVLHLTSQRPETAARLAERASEAGVTVSFDPGRRLGQRDYSSTLALADVVFLNDREAATALDECTDHGAETIVLKHGPRGAEVRASEETFTHPGFAVETVDTTGAGDAFAAGFLASRVRGDGYDEALAVANACGALAARSAGARIDVSWTAVSELVGH